MPQEKNISISTISTIDISTNKLVSEIFFDQNLPDTTSSLSDFQDEPDLLKLEIILEKKIINSVSFNENELFICIKENLDLNIDITGELLILHENSNNFSINDMGELEYFFNI